MRLQLLGNRPSAAADRRSTVGDFFCRRTGHFLCCDVFLARRRKDGKSPRAQERSSSPARRSRVLLLLLLLLLHCRTSALNVGESNRDEKCVLCVLCYRLCRWIGDASRTMAIALPRGNFLRSRFCASPIVILLLQFARNCYVRRHN